MRWACRTVESRWATTIAVRWAVARRSERWMAASVSLSTALVASSSTSTAGSRSSARARASRCRWPPDRVTPRSPTQVSRPSGIASMKSSAAAASAAARDLLAGGVGSAVGDVVGDGAGEHEDVLGDVAERAAQRVPVEVAHVLAVEEDRALAGVVEAQHQPQQRRLPRAGGAHDRVGLARRARRRSMPCRTSGPSAYPARTPRSSTRPATGRSSAVAPAGTVTGTCEQAEDAGRRRAAALVEVEDLGDLGQRPEQPLRHEDQHGVEADLEVAAQRRPAAEQQRAGEAGQDRHPHQRHERGRGADRVGVGPAVGQGDGGDAVALAVLGGERLDGGDARRCWTRACWRGRRRRRGPGRRAARGDAGRPATR